jgi:lipopolysaccharide/colanic/teichoic acid biosynthesis glycosyltransferase
MVKRLIDILLSLLALIILSPILIIIKHKVSTKLGNPVLFKQKRPGLNGKIFEMIKFRSMRDAIDGNGVPLPDSERLTPFGKKLRDTSLDELPGLWNVFIGNMSLVGPRPLLVEYLPLYSKEQARRHHVKPGITGWAQVNGRNAISWEKKFQLDVWYVDNHSFWVDMKILFLTVKKVLMRTDITAVDHVTMTVFKGKNNDNPR